MRISNNVKIISTNAKSRNKTTHKLTLEEALQGARQAKRKFVEPIKQSLLDQGYSEGHHLTKYMEGVESKFLSFAKSLEPSLSSSLNKKVSDLRQVAWRKAKRKSRRGIHPYWACIIGTMFSFRGMVIVSTCREDLLGTWVDHNFKVKLPPGRFSIRKRMPLEDAYYESHPSEGPHSKYGSELDYETTFSSDMQVVYVDELKELKHIYRAFWHGQRCRKNWLRALYDVESHEGSGRLVSYGTSRFYTPYGDVEEGRMIFEVDFEEIEVSIDTLYHWICEYRIPGKEYAIGDCEDHKLVLYSLLLTEVHHRDPIAVASGFKSGVLEEQFRAVGNLFTTTVDLEMSVSDATTSLSEIMARFGLTDRTQTVKPEDLERMFTIDEDDEEFKDIHSSSTLSRKSHSSERSVDPYAFTRDYVPPDGSVYSDESDDHEDSEKLSSGKSPPDNTDWEKKANPSVSFRLRGWFEGEAVTEFPDAQPNSYKEPDGDLGYESDQMLPKELSDKDKLGFVMVDPETWRPMGTTTQRQLKYIWGIKPRSAASDIRARRVKFAKLDNG